MATVKIEVVAGAQTYTNTRTVTGPHLVRFISDNDYCSGWIIMVILD